MDRNEKSHDQVFSTATSGAEEDPAGDSKLAQSIWGRYGHSPGVIPTAVTLGLARRITGLSANRVPLLAHMQRRWAGAGFSFPRRWSALSYISRGFTGTLSSSTKMVQSASEPASADFGRANPMAQSRDVDRSQRVVSALPAKVATGTERPTAERIQRRSVGPLISQGKEEAPILQPAAGPAQPAGNGQDEVSVATSVGDLGAAILRRHLHGPAARAIQSRPKALETGHFKSRGRANLQVGRKILMFDVFHPIEQPVVLTRAIPWINKMSLVQYHPDKADDSMPTKIGWNTGPLISQGKEAPMPRPATGGEQPAGKARIQVYMANRTENLGVSIVRRYLRGTAARVIQRKTASPDPGHLYGSMTADIRKSAGGRPTAHRSTFDLVGPALNRPAVDAISKSSNLETITRQKEERGESLVAEIPTTSSRAVTPLQSVILRKRIGAHAKDGPNPDTSEKLTRNAEDSNHPNDPAPVNGIVPTQPSVTIAQTEADGSSSPGMMVRAQPRHSASATGYTRSGELSQSPVSLVNAHMILRKFSTRQSYEPQGKPMVSQMGLVTAQPAALVVQPQQEGVETKNWQSTGKTTGAADRDRASVTVQTSAGLTRLPKPDMVWRKSTIESSASSLFSAGTSAGAKTSLPLTINPAGGSVLSMARQTTTSSGPAVEPGTSEGSESPIPIGEKGPGQSNEMDLQQLAEQVSRLIFRKLAVERERRGIGRWH